MYAIYGNIYHQYTPFMLAYIPAPWIRHGKAYWYIDFGSSPHVAGHGIPTMAATITNRKPSKAHVFLNKKKSWRKPSVYGWKNWIYQPIAMFIDVQEKQVSEISRRFRRYKNMVFAAGPAGRGSSGIDGVFRWERWICPLGKLKLILINLGFSRTFGKLWQCATENDGTCSFSSLIYLKRGDFVP